MLVIAETNAYDFEEFHLTEKTIKALLTGMPFIIMGSYKFLQNLQVLGFRTFNEVWAEEYDKIENFNQRLDAIIEVLNSLNKETFIKNQHKLLEIANHNKAQFLHLNTVMRDQLLEIIKTLT